MLSFAFKLLKTKELKEMVQISGLGLFELVTNLLGAKDRFRLVLGWLGEYAYCI